MRFVRRLNVTDLIERAEFRERRDKQLLWKLATLFLLGAGVGLVVLWILVGGKL